MDLHAITAPHNPKLLQQETLDAAALYIAAGIDPEKSPIFVQSHVTAHAELCWLLNCMTPINWLERMIQYKEKKQKQGENVGRGVVRLSRIDGGGHIVVSSGVGAGGRGPAPAPGVDEGLLEGSTTCIVKEKSAFSGSRKLSS